MQTKFSKEELERYSRHLIIPEFNIQGQTKLKDARVLVVGSGGLGAPLLQYLAAAGVGHIGIVDFDVVEESNLQRQVLFTVRDVGKPKAEAAKQRILALNPHITVDTYNIPLNSENALEVINGYDIVADGTDNFPTRYLVNDACYLLGIPNVYASIYRFEGQVSVFNQLKDDGERGPNFRDLFPSPPPPGLVPSCAEGGVIGVLPGIIGSLQASEVIKVITGVGETLSGRLFLFDAASFSTRIVNVRKDPSNPLSGDTRTITKLIDYQEFCGIPSNRNPKKAHGQKSISVETLLEWRNSDKNHQLIDVRNPYEYSIVHIDGTLIPLEQLPDRIEGLKREIPVVIHCRSGIRSGKAIEMLENEYGFENLYNLEGGILAWVDRIDSSLPKY